MADGADLKEQIAGPLRLDGVRSMAVRPLRTPLTISRVRCAVSNHGMTELFPREDAYLVIVQLGAACSKQMWIGGRALPPAVCPEGAFMLMNLQLEPQAYLRSAFDTLQFYLPQAVLDEIADDSAVTRIGSLSCPQGICLSDPVVQQLGRCLVPALDTPQYANQLFLEYVVLALSTHLASKYGGMVDAASFVQGGLAPWQERRAVEYMTARIAEDIPLSQVAAECELSRSHFCRAFKRSIGTPPHRWLLDRRIEQAKNMMLSSDLTLAEIAYACGFSDQSHLARKFAQKVGVAPSAWRHERRH